MADLLETTEQLGNNKAETEGSPIGQVFTPAAVARFMASRLRTIPACVHLLDPGAGAGVLTAAVCERIARLKKPRRVFAELWETDAAVLPLLTKTLDHCRDILAAGGHQFAYEILTDDFILDNAPRAGNGYLFGAQRGPVDIAILNPPYYKLNAGSPQARAMTDLFPGQPNAYAAFLALTALRLKDTGGMVAITPRSFCNGLYFKGFRRFLLSRLGLHRVHVFESRSKTFESQSVLQETIITAWRGGQPEAVEITTSACGAFERVKRVSVPASAIIRADDTEGIIRLPASKHDLEVVGTFDALPDTFASLGLGISTGPVVDFRCRDKLTDEPNGVPVVPLLWMHNIKGKDIVYPRPKRGRPAFVVDDSATAWMLVPDANYVITKRFSAKEEKRRIVAGLLRKGQLGYPRVGLENHLNYIYLRDGETDLELAEGLAGWFNSEIADRYFRILNGNTQVNATEIRAMPMPPLSFLREIGKRPLTDRELEQRLRLGV